MSKACVQSRKQHTQHSEKHPLGVWLIRDQNLNNKEHTKVNHRQANDLIKKAKRSRKTFLQNLRMANRSTKRCLPSLVTRELEIKPL